MSVSSHSLPFVVPKPSAVPFDPAQKSDRKLAPSRIIRRRPTMQQGQVLEILGHAIEYLIDSRMFLVSEPHTPAETEAVQLLSRCSREVFAECAEIVPVTERFRQWAAERLRVGSLSAMRHHSARR